MVVMVVVVAVVAIVIAENGKCQETMVFIDIFIEIVDIT